MKLATLFSSLLLVVFLSFLFIPVASAVDIKPPVCDDNPSLAVCDINDNQSATENTLVGEDGLITRAAQVLVWASGIIALILIIIAGLMFIFSQGNAESAGRARSTVLYAVIGMVIAVVGQAIISFVLIRLGGQP